MRTLTSLVAFASLALPAAASAHPGHGLDPTGASLLHWLGNPEHALPIFGIAALATVLWGLASSDRRAT